METAHNSEDSGFPLGFVKAHKDPGEDKTTCCDRRVAAIIAGGQGEVEGLPSLYKV